MIYKAFLFLVRPFFAGSFRLFSPVLASKWRADRDIKCTNMNQICVTTRPSRSGNKTWYYLEWGKAPDQRRAAGIFTYSPAKNQTQRNHNKEAEAILEIKKSQLTIDFQAIGTGYIPSHRFKHNFLDFYQDFVDTNARKGNRHLEGSLSKFKTFVKRDKAAPIEITENLCNLFRAHLQDTLTGKTPLDYFNAFKRVVRSASKEGYFRQSPAADLHASTNASKKLKDFLETDELLALIGTPNQNEDIKRAFIFCCYSGLRWCDINTLAWSQIRLTKNGWILISRIIQKKTGKPVEITLHPIVVSILEEKRKEAEECFGPKPTVKMETSAVWEPEGRVFEIGTQNGCNKNLGIWGQQGGLLHGLEELSLKELTWHSARLTFSILLQDQGVDAATIALLLGHTTTKYVLEVYKRHRPKNQMATIVKLPKAHWNSAKK
jgi:integrase